jgi:hypothetical protein
LPRREASALALADGLNRAVGSSDMGAKRVANVINESPVHLLWLGERKQQQATETLHDRVFVSASMPNIRSVNALLADVVVDLIKRSARKIEAQSARRTTEFHNRCAA